MKKKLFLSASTLLLSVCITAQNEWNSTPNSTVPMYRDGFVGIGSGASPVLPLVVKDVTAGNGTKVSIGSNGLIGSYGAASAMLEITSANNPDGAGLALWSGSGSNRFGLTLLTGAFGTGFYATKGPTGIGQDLFFATYGSAGMTEKMRIEVDGKVRIGSLAGGSPGTYKLYVEDGILTEKVKVAIDATINWSDHVFANSYKLRPLEEVDAFIKKNKHLPGVPSAEEVVKDGIDVATMDAKLLEKIEELTLYVIAQKKEMEKMKKELAELKAIK